MSANSCLTPTYPCGRVRRLFILSLALSTIAHLVLISFNSLLDLGMRAVLEGEYGHELLPCMIRFHFWVITWYVLALEVFWASGLICLFRLGPKGIKNYLNRCWDFANAKENIFLSVTLTIIISLTIIPAVLPFAPYQFYFAVGVFLVMTVITRYYFCSRNLKQK
ncbi:hypothetical protein MOMUL_29230 [Moorella mulderi DSM 14980]|uniref:Uncharacterized protein n=1 Tax=Moorella mulderi DSM 14980 TaxID=1122241 RepID=A0A151AT13_9FIRM|nr:hypothetical protein MOMUL_29230 [Moorella mulderi DSM 14980]